MSDEQSHEALVDRQFGPRAAAFLNSTIHSGGADLEALVALVNNGPERVLDLGCGAGHVSFKVAPLAKEVVAYDLSAKMLEVVAGTAKERGFDNIVTRQGLVESLPFEDHSFDCVLSRYSAHHWQDLEAGLKEAARILKPGGVAGFVDAVSPGVPLLDTHLQAVEVLRDPSHVRNYSPVEWQAAMIRAGFKLQSFAAHHVRIDFASAVERMRTPKVLADAIRALQVAMSASVARHFAIARDGSFTLDVGLFQATKP